MPLDVVVEFKRGVYEMALTELSRFVPRFDARPDHRSRYLRGGVGVHQRDAVAMEMSAAGGLVNSASLAQNPPQIHFQAMRPGAAFELPPGASFDPDPKTDLLADPL